MKKSEYLKQLKQLIKKFHPDLCKDEYLEKIYNEITIKLNARLDQIKADNNFSAGCKDPARHKNPAPDKSYEYYKLGIKHYRNIHPNQFFRRNADSSYEAKSYEEQLNILNKIYISFGSAEYYFTKVITEFPNSEWANDAKDKIKLLKKLYKSYENLNTEDNKRIIDSGKFIKEMGLKLM